jgi:hypothetical protein
MRKKKRFLSRKKGNAQQVIEFKKKRGKRWQSQSFPRTSTLLAGYRFHFLVKIQSISFPLYFFRRQIYSIKVKTFPGKVALVDKLIIKQTSYWSFDQVQTERIKLSFFFLKVVNHNCYGNSLEREKKKALTIVCCRLSEATRQTCQRSFINVWINR